MASSSTLQERLSSIRAVLLDMDGVVYVGNTPLPGVQEFLDYLDATGRTWLCITNNSSRTPEMYVDKLAAMHIGVQPENVLGSAQATASWLAQQYPLRGDHRAKVIMLGQEGLRSALVNEQFALVDDPSAADVAVVGINFDLQYDQVADVALAIQNGARFIGTNPDTTFPSERGHIPGTGSIVAMLQAATDVQPVIIGKPNRGMFDLAMQRLGVTAAETMMVGDRYETDIVGAVKLGIATVAVLTGITSQEEFAQADPPPDIVLDDLPALLHLFQQYG